LLLVIEQMKHHLDAAEWTAIGEDVDRHKFYTAGLLFFFCCCYSSLNGERIIPLLLDYQLESFIIRFSADSAKWTMNAVCIAS